MKAVPKFDIAQYAAAHESQESYEISYTQGLANGQQENTSDEISRLAGLASHNDEVRNFSDQEVIRILNQATYKTGISAQQFWCFCDAGDIADIYAGQYSLEQLTAYAKSWARYPETVPEVNKLLFPTLEPETVLCKKCQHFIPDKVGDGTGIGNCYIKAPASNKSSLWLSSQVICSKYKTSV